MLILSIMAWKSLWWSRVLPRPCSGIFSIGCSQFNLRETCNWKLLSRSQPQVIHVQHNSCASGSRNVVEEANEDSRGQGNMMSAMRLHILEMSGKQYSQHLNHMLPKQDMDKNNTNKHTTMTGLNFRRSHKQQRNAEPWRNSLFQVGTHQVVIQCQIVSTEKIHYTETE